MNQLFSFSRFGRLFAKHTTEHAGQYLLATGVLLGLLGLLLGLANYWSNYPMPVGVQEAFFTMGLLLTGTFFTSLVFAPFGDKKKATAALLLPASQLEKFLVGWVYSLPVFVAAYVGCFFLIDSLVYRLHSTPAHPGELLRLFGGGSKAYVALVVYAVVQSVFLWGSIFFTRQQFVRLAFGLLGSLALLVFVNFQALEMLLGRSLDFVLPFSEVMLREGSKLYSVAPTPAQLGLLRWVPLGVMGLAWAAAYFRLKEKQI